MREGIEPARHRRGTVWTRYQKHRGGVAGLLVVAFLTGVALLAPAMFTVVAQCGVPLPIPKVSHPLVDRIEYKHKRAST